MPESENIGKENLIVLIYFQGPLQHYILVSESFTVVLNFYSRCNSICGRKSQNGQWKMIFFSIKLNLKSNLYSKYVIKVVLAGITYLGRSDLAIKELPGMSFKVKWRLSAVPKAFELSSQFFQTVGSAEIWMANFIRNPPGMFLNWYFWNKFIVRLSLGLKIEGNFRLFVQKIRFFL